MKHFLLLALAAALYIYLAPPAAAQHAQHLQGFGIEANAFAGHVIKHSAKFQLPVPELTTGFDVNMVWKTWGRKEWHQRRRYPVIGIALAYTNYGIDSVYGRCFSIYPNILIPLISTKKLEWTIRIGDGAGYVTRRYSRQQPFDTLNNAIGSHINDYFSFNTDIRYHLTDQVDIQLGGNFSHISNASYRQPNLGINLYGAHIGIRYFPVTSRPQVVRHQLPVLSNRWLAQFRLSMAFNQAQAPLGPLYPVYIATGYASKRWLGKNKVFAGADVAYHGSIYAYLLSNGAVIPRSAYAGGAYKSAVFIGNEFLLGRLGVILQAGYYIKDGYQTQGALYQKLGGHFYLLQNERGPIKELFISGLLKTHLSVAELTEFGFGMGF